MGNLGGTDVELDAVNRALPGLLYVGGQCLYGGKVGMGLKKGLSLEIQSKECVFLGHQSVVDVMCDMLYIVDQMG